MAMVIQGGSDTFNALLYGATPHVGTMSYLSGEMDKLQSFSGMLKDVGNAFVNRATDIYNRFNSSDAMRLARAAVNKVASIFQRDGIFELKTLGEIQNAPPTMQRYIMAEPTLRELFLKQRVDGYAETYLNVHGNNVGEYHYDYRRVMNGVVEIVRNDPEIDWRATTYLDELLDGDRELEFTEQIAIRRAWKEVREFLNREEDPTSVYGNKL